MSEQGISFTSLLVLAGIGFMLYRFFFAPTSPSSRGNSSRSGQRVNIAAVEQVAAMFPQLDRRAIAWDLQRNGGNAQASVERMLTTGRLETPPPSFQPQGLNPPQATNASGVTGAAKSAKKAHPDLITRYKLSEKLKQQQEEEAEAEVPETQNGKAASSGWSKSPQERTAMLQQRREAMILAARRQMEEKDRRDSKGKAKEVVQ